MFDYLNAPPIDTVVDLNFVSTYPVYLKMWSWVTKNINNINGVFPCFRKWENQEFERIFRDFKTKEVFGTEIIEFIKYVYLYHIPENFKATKIQVEDNPITTEFYTIIINDYHFYFVQCANKIILCNVYYNRELQEYFNIKDYLGGKGFHPKNTENDSFIQYKNNVWFINTNHPFMSYPDGIMDNLRETNKSRNIPFYSDFKQSYFQNYIDTTNEWYQGCRTVVSKINPAFTWEFVEGTDINEKLVIITGFRRSLG